MQVAVQVQKLTAVSLLSLHNLSR